MKSDRYLNESRLEIDQLLPPLGGAILDIGAANLRVAQRLLLSPGIERYDYIEPVGSPQFSDTRLKKIGSCVEEWAPCRRKYQLILALDVIEHVADTKMLLKKVHSALMPAGYLLTSVPNVAHYSVLRRLCMGDFPYTESGILDETHLRFFTPRSFDSIMNAAGFSKQASVFKDRRGGVCFMLATFRCYQYLSLWRLTSPT